MGLEAEVNMEIKRGQGFTDGGSDIRIFGTEILIDVKTVKGRSQWLLLEHEKIIGVNPSAVYVLMRTDLPAGIEKDLALIRSPILAECLGYAFLEDFYDATGAFWFDYLQGDKLMTKSFISAIVDCNRGRFPESVKALEETIFTALKEWPYAMRSGPKLKCPRSVGLPASELRRDFQELLDPLRPDPLLF
jgi:hypothetical protein